MASYFQILIMFIIRSLNIFIRQHSLRSSFRLLCWSLCMRGLYVLWLQLYANAYVPLNTKPITNCIYSKRLTF